MSRPGNLRADVEALGELVMEAARQEAAAEGMDSPARRWLSQAAQCLGAAQAEIFGRQVRAAAAAGDPFCRHARPAALCPVCTAPTRVRVGGLVVDAVRQPGHGQGGEQL